MIEESILTGLISVLMRILKFVGKKVFRKRRKVRNPDLALNLSLNKLTMGNFSVDGLNLELKQKS